MVLCKVTAPNNLEHPLIQKHVKGPGGIRTISPVVTFNHWVFSPSIIAYSKKGYIFEVLKGYTFDSEIVFDKYVDTLYELRLKYPKTNPMNYIAKILMNSLFGRFGMSDNHPEIAFVDKDEFETLLISGPSISSMELTPNLFCVTIENDNIDSMMDNGSETHNINIAVAAAISEYARIEMSVLKNRDDIKLFYTDTDSAYVNAPLDSTLISNTELGKFKLEHICSKGIFLAPKVYGLLTTEGNEIIKIKGLNKAGISNLSIASLEALLKQDETLTLNQERWFKKLQDGTITVKEQLYSLTVTGNKRELIYNNGILVGTKPFVLNGEVINNNKIS